MIKDGFINIYGFYAEDFVEGDSLPCPKCGKVGTCEVVRSLEYDPPGYRLKCSACGHVSNEAEMVYSYNNNEGIREALAVWNRESLISEAFKAQQKFEEENKVIFEDLKDAEKVAGGETVVKL